MQELRDLKRKNESETECDAVGSEMCERVRAGLSNTPCDVVQTPLTMEDTSRRVLACMPANSPYQQVEICRKDLTELRRTFQAAPAGGHAALA